MCLSLIMQVYINMCIHMCMNTFLSVNTVLELHFSHTYVYMQASVHCNNTMSWLQSLHVKDITYYQNFFMICIFGYICINFEYVYNLLFKVI